MKKIVIIGAGFAGAYCAIALEKNFDVTLVDTKDYFEFTPSVLRTIVEPGHVKKIQSLHTQYLLRAKVIMDDVIEVTENSVVCKNTELEFDYLIIASGSSYNTPFKHDDIVAGTRAHELRDCYKRLCKSKEILIIGGGLVGVEIAAEIATHYSGKSITIVHSHHRLMERQPLKASKYAENFLKRKGVKIFFDEKVKERRDDIFVTDRHREIKTDMPFMCVGIKANSSFMGKNFREKLDKMHCINVNKFLQLMPRIFACGDVAAITEEKTAQNAEKQAEIVVHNILALESGKELREYASKPRAMVISLGKYCGILSYNGFVFTGLIPGIMKTLIEWKTMKRYK